MRYVIDTQTGTMLNVEHCYIVEATHLPDEDLSDSELSKLATEKGTSLTEIGSDTGWGDNKYCWTVSYSPYTFVDEAIAWLDGGIYTEGETEHEALVWVASKATKADLAEMSSTIMSYDSIWDGFRGLVMDVILEHYQHGRQDLD
jgi:hypothetical protein